MMKAGWGRIVNIASTQAIATEATVGAYAASKGAIISFTKSLAVELAPFGINANAIAPGCIHTPMSIVNGVDETTTEYFQTWYVGKRKIPLARAGRPEEIARVALFLASDDASYVTGHTLVADGDLTICGSRKFQPEKMITPKFYLSRNSTTIAAPLDAATYSRLPFCRATPTMRNSRSPGPSFTKECASLRRTGMASPALMGAVSSLIWAEP